jgi:two-component system sensor histidine kinase MtrB
VVANLLGNAVEHGDPPVVLGARSEGRTVRVTVRDHGPGVDPARLANLFDRGPRDDGSPRGRGLPIVASLVRAMDGRVHVTTPEDGGTLFTVTLPSAADA